MDDKLESPQADATAVWPVFRKLLIFQVKLYVDAVRDVLLSLLSLGAFLIDLVQRNPTEDSYFTRVLKFGQRTERAINLFNQHDPASQDRRSVDGIIREVEDRLR